MTATTPVTFAVHGEPPGKWRSMVCETTPTTSIGPWLVFAEAKP
jgi:hypothetical protein